jgi:pimeloyl-ACP methyl ester carboxylesterase
MGIRKLALQILIGGRGAERRDRTGQQSWGLALLAKVVVATLALAGLASIGWAQPAWASQHALSVLLDYADSGAGRADLFYEFGAPFNPKKRTVLLVADGQQFYVQPGAAARLQKQLFGPNVNVVGLVTRGSTPAFVKATLGPDGKVDWARAWRLFNSMQWIEDIESVRRAVVGDAQIMLYGRSGGAYLVHQYLAAHAEHVSRAFTQSPVNPIIARDLGIRLDRFWDHLGRTNPELQPILAAALKRRSDESIRMLLALQRQHFFVPQEQETAERARLIRAFDDGDDGTYFAMLKAYQVEDVMTLLNSNDSIPQNVRVLELIGPSGEFEAPTAPVSPLIDPQKSFAAGLIALEQAGRIRVAPFDFAPAHRAKTEVFILAAREDEAVDYRTTIAFAYAYPHVELFIADDNHTFLKMSGAGADGQLIRAFFTAGLGSKTLDQELKAAGIYRWKE